jgi:DHA1 family multidrug resistance protein-like MFS transporter
MATQLRNTQFGNLVRLISGKRLFRYPDEVDSSLWKAALQRNETSIIAGGGTPFTEGKEGVNGADGIAEEGGDVFLIDWYGPEDPEVSIP